MAVVGRGRRGAGGVLTLAAGGGEKPPLLFIWWMINCRPAPNWPQNTHYCKQSRRVLHFMEPALIVKCSWLQVAGAQPIKVNKGGGGVAVCPIAVINWINLFIRTCLLWFRNATVKEVNLSTICNWWCKRFGHLFFFLSSCKQVEVARVRARPGGGGLVARDAS